MKKLVPIALADSHTTTVNPSRRTARSLATSTPKFEDLAVTVRPVQILIAEQRLPITCCVAIAATAAAAPSDREQARD